MTTEPLYLKESVRVEPLVQAFRAWTHLIAPQTLAVNLSAKYVPDIEHALSSSDGNAYPSQEERAALESLYERMTVDGRDLLELATAIRELDQLLEKEATGASLEPLYPSVPDPLKGYVELVYDRASRATPRFIEGLLYASDYYRPDWQGAYLSDDAGSDGSLGLRKPRLAAEQAISHQLPFTSGSWDELAAARINQPRPFEWFAEVLDVSEEGQVERLRSMLTSQPPVSAEVPPLDTELRVRFFGHACLLIETGGGNVLVDPLIGYRESGQLDRPSYADLPETIDYLAITHGHMDHLDVETLMQLRHRVNTVVVPKNNGGDLMDTSLKLIIQALGFTDVREAEEMESFPLGEGALVAVPFLGEHSDLNIRAKSGYIVRAGGRAVFCTADACNHESQMYRGIQRAVGSVDAAFIGMECEGSSLTMANGPYLAREVSTEVSDSRRTHGSDCAAALGMVDALGARQAYIYAMGLEPWLAFMFGVPDETRSYSMEQVELFSEECRTRDVHAELLRGARTLTF